MLITKLNSFHNCALIKLNTAVIVLFFVNPPLANSEVWLNFCSLYALNIKRFLLINGLFLENCRNCSVYMRALSRRLRETCPVCTVNDDNDAINWNILFFVYKFAAAAYIRFFPRMQETIGKPKF